MMKWFKAFTLVSVLSVACAHSGDAHGAHPGLIEKLSLPSLSTVQDIADITNIWNLEGAAQLDNGRIVLTPRASVSKANEVEFHHGAIWSKSLGAIQQANQYSLELTARSVGDIGDTQAGLSIWLIQQTFDPDTSNFGGPKFFSGLQILIDSNDRSLKSVIRVFLNDGTKSIEVSNDYIGAYAFEYQDSQVPFTFKVGFDDTKKWLKLTIDNKLIFESKDIDLSTVLFDKSFLVGVTGYSLKDVIHYEQWEVMALQSYKSILPELTVDQTQTLFAKHSQLSGTTGQSSNFHEKQQQLIEKLKSKSSSDSGSVSSKDGAEIMKRLGAIEELLTNSPSSPQAVLAQQLSKQVFDVTKSLKSYTEKTTKSHLHLENKLSEMSTLISRQEESIQSLVNQLNRFSAFVDDQNKHNINLNDRLVKMHQDYSTHQNEQRAKLESTDQYDQLYNNFTKALRYLSIFLVLSLIVIIFFVSRLRSDIKHSKIF